MDLTRQEKLFVEKRAKFARSWPIVGAALLAMIAVLAAWLFFSNPLLINPWAVLSKLEAGSLPDSTLATMATLLPVVMFTCLFVLVVALVFFWVAFSNERKHLALIRRLTSHQTDLGDQ